MKGLLITAQLLLLSNQAEAESYHVSTVVRFCSADESCIQEAGINYINPQDYEKDVLVDAFLKARGHGADFIVVSIHWGPKWAGHPSDSMVQLAHTMVNSGADIIYGHGSYNFQVLNL